ncbi:MAG TPA: molybdate ABC transporter permease subunit [Methylophaga sp.]|nr:molybdate ABC transporter permease subunit [Methylophaga sp.]
MHPDLTALFITLKLAAITTLILLIIGTPLAWWLAKSQWRFKFIIETIIALPLVLPPTVLGFYLLIMLGPNGPIGGLAESLGGKSLAFTFTGLIIGSVIYSLPFVVQPLQNIFTTIGDNVMHQAATMRAGPIDRFFSVMVPLAKPGFLTAAVLGFAHTIGEFGVVLMIGGNIPGSTKVISIAIYDHVESLEYAQAHLLSAGLLALSFLLLMAVYGLNRRFSVLRT